MSNDWKEDFKFHWSLATCTLEDEERVIANEKLEAILQSDMFNEKQTEILYDTLNHNTAGNNP